MTLEIHLTNTMAAVAGQPKKNRGGRQGERRGAHDIDTGSCDASEEGEFVLPFTSLLTILG